MARTKKADLLAAKKETSLVERRAQKNEKRDSRVSHHSKSDQAARAARILDGTHIAVGQHPASRATLAANAFQPGEGEPIVLNATQLKHLKSMAEAHLPQLMMARALKISLTTLRAILDRDEDAAGAIIDGEASLHMKLYKRLMKEKSFIAQIFVAKSLGGWRDGEQVGGQGGPRVIINMPGAQSAAQHPVGKIIDVTPEDTQ